MSLANQANEKLSQLVSLTARIELLLSSKAKGKETEKETANVGSKQSESTFTKDATAISGLSSSMSELIKATGNMDPKAGNNLAKFIISMTDAVSDAAKKGLNIQKVKELNESLKSLSEGSAGFLKEMAKGVLYGIPAMLGAVFFGTTIKILLGIIGKTKGIDVDTQESIKTILSMGKGALLFGLAMSAYTIIGIPAMLGATMFGTTILILTKILSKAPIATDINEQTACILSMADGSFMFGLKMSAYVLLGIPAMLGASMFSTTLLILSKSLSNVKDTSDQVKAILSATDGSLRFGLKMAAYAIVGIPAMLGAAMFGTTLLILSKTLSNVTDNTEQVNAILSTADGSLMFGLKMAGYALFGIPAMLGAAMFGATLLILSKTLGNVTDTTDQVNALLETADGSLRFGLKMAAYAILGIPAMLGAAMFGTTLLILSKSLSNVTDNSEQAKVMLEAADSSLRFGLKMTAYAILGIPAMLGAAMFGTTLLILTKTLSNVTDTTEQVKSILSASDGSLQFGLKMGAYAILGTPAMLGAAMFGTTLLILTKSLSNVTDNTEQVKTIIESADGSLRFGLKMAAYSLIGIPAMLGTAMFGTTLLILSKTLSNVIDTTEHVKVMLETADGSLRFGLKMAAYSLLGIPAMLGAAMFGATLLILTKSFGKVTDTTEQVNTVIEAADGSLRFGLKMAAYSLLGIPAMLGAAMFGTTLLILTKSFSKVTNTAEQVKSVLEAADGSLQFGFKLAAYALLGIPAMLGAAMFGTTLLILSKSLSNVTDTTEQVKTVIESADGSLRFGLKMAAYAILGIPAMLGAAMFGTTLLILSKSLSNVTDTTEQVKAVIESADGSLRFGLKMATYSLLGIPAMLGAAMFGTTLLILSKSLSNVTDTTEQVKSILTASDGSLRFGLTMATYSLLGIPAMLGAAMFGTTLLILSKTLGKVTNTTEHIKAVVEAADGSLRFGLKMAAYAILGIPAMLGAAMFGTTLLILTKSFSKVTDTTEQVKSILSASDGSLMFGLKMAAYAILGIPAMLGAAMFGTTLLILSKSLSNVTDTTEPVNAVVEAADGSLRFGLKMAAYSLLGIPAMLGAAMFGTTLLILSKTLGKVTDTTEQVKFVLESADGSLRFGLKMAAYAILGIPAMLGTAMFGATLLILSKTLGNVTDTSNQVNSLIESADGSLRFGLKMVAYSLLGIPAMLGAAMFGATLLILSKTLGNVTDTSDQVKLLIEAADGSLMFGLKMTGYAILGIPAMLGTAMFGTTLLILSKTLGKVTDTTEQVKSLIEAADGSLRFGLKMTGYAILGIPAMLGAAMFGATLLILSKSFGNVTDSTDQVKSLIEAADGSLRFGLKMTAYAILGIPAMLGTAMFGTTLLILAKIFANVTDTSEQVKTVIESADGSLRFGLKMVAYSLIGIPAMLGAAMFGTTLLILSKILSNVTDTSEQVKTIVEIADGSLRFGLKMTAYAILGIPAMLGAAMFGTTILMLSKILSNVTDTSEQVKEIIETADGSLRFGLKMTAYAILGIPAMLGAAMFSATVLILSKVLSKSNLTKDSQESVNVILSIAKGALLFGLGMAAYTILGIPAMLGAAMFGTTLLILSKILERIPSNKDVKEKLDGILSIAKGALLFGLAMTAIGFFAKEFAMGALVFITAVSAMLFILNKVSATKDATDGVAAILKLAKGAALFALTMVGIGLVSPLFAMGALAFTLVVSAMLLILSKVTGTKIVTDGIEAILKLAKGAALFALTMVGIGLVSPLFAIGALAFTLVVSAMLLILSKVSATKVVTTGINAILRLAKGAALFAITMVGIGLFAKQFAIGALVFILAASAMLAIFGALSAAFPAVMTGAKALDIIFKGAFKFGLTMIAIGLFAQQFAIGALAFILAAGAMLLVFGLLSTAFPNILVGAKALDSITKRIIPFTLALLVAGFFPKQIALGGISLALSMALIGGAVALLGHLDKAGNIGFGAKALTKLIAPMIGFSVGLAIVGSLIKDDPKTLALKMLVLGGAIVGLGLAAAALGIPIVAPFVELGAGVLISLAAALLVFAGALWVLSKADFNKEKTDNLGYAMGTIGLEIAKIGLMSVGVLLGSIALIPASIALFALAPALSKFKTVDWQESDGVSLKSALSSVVQGFSHALDGVGITGLLKIMAAIPLIAGIGNAMVSLAAGVQAMATMSFTEMEYDKRLGKLIPKRVIRLTDSDIQAAGTNTAAILSALAEPLTKFGEWADAGTYGFGPISVGSGYMEKGINMASKIGNIIISLASGVQGMANLEVIEYGVINGGTDRAKLVPMRSRKLNEADFSKAANNVKAILSAIAAPLVDFGKWSEAGTYGFGPISLGSGYLQNGIDAASKISGIVLGLAKGVQQMANGQVQEYVVINGGTAKAKIVPKGNPTTLGPDHFAKAGLNVKAILSALAKPLVDFGRDFNSGSSWISSSDLESGIDAMSKIVDPIAKMADMVIKMAGGSATINEVINPGTKNAKLVPKGTISFAAAIPGAIAAAKKMLYAFPVIFVNLGKYITKFEDDINTAIDFMPKMSSAVKDITNISKNYLAITKNIAEANAAGKSPTGVLISFASSLSAMGTSFGKLDNNKLDLYKKFASVTTGLTKIVSPFEKFTKLFGTFTKEMGSFVRVWNSFGKGDASNLKSYADSLKVIASVDAGKLKAITQALKDQAKAQADLNKQQTPNATATPTTAPTATDKTKTAVTTKNDVKTPIASSGPSTQKGPAPSKANQVVAELHVTNLYIAGILQK